MRITFVSNVSLPIRTGPSMTAAARSNYFIQNYDVTLWYPYVNERFQTKLWGMIMSKERYITYLRKELVIDKRVRIELYDSEYDSMLRWQYPASASELLRIVLSVEDVVVFEDCVSIIIKYPHIFFTPKRCVHVIHTDYVNILPMIPREISLKYIKMWFSVALPCEIISYNEQIEAPIRDKRHSFSVMPIHGVRPCFDSEAMPLSNSVYFMSKLDNEHKNFTELCEFTKGVCELNAYGEGKDERLLTNYSHVIHHGVAKDVPEAIKEHKILVHASMKEGIATVIAEAIHMNKYVLVKNADCHSMFRNIPNVYFYDSQADFVIKLHVLLDKPPSRISIEDKFTWRKANRLLELYLGLN